MSINLRNKGVLTLCLPLLLTTGLAAQPLWFHYFSSKFDPAMNWYRQQTYPEIQDHDSLVHVSPDSTAVPFYVAKVGYNSRGVADTLTEFRQPEGKIDRFLISRELNGRTMIKDSNGITFHPLTTHRFFFSYNGQDKVNRIEVKDKATNLPGDYQRIGYHKISYNAQNLPALIHWKHINPYNNDSWQEQQYFFWNARGQLDSTLHYRLHHDTLYKRMRSTNDFAIRSGETIVTEQNVTHWKFSQSTGTYYDTTVTRYRFRRNNQGKVNAVVHYTKNNITGQFEALAIVKYLRSSQYFSQDEYGEKDALAIYPNPVEDKLWIQGFQSGLISISSLDGDFKIRRVVEDSHVDTSVLPAGIYIITFPEHESSHKTSFKFLKK